MDAVKIRIRRNVRSAALRMMMVAIAVVGACADARIATVADDSGWSTLQDGTVVLFRHANAPGVGDPSNFKLGDCSTQRNLDAEGRVQARRIGRAFQQRRVPVAEVWTSEWCRARETAQLAFPDRARAVPAFNSFFGDVERRRSQTREALQLLSRWTGPGVLVVVTHQVNITALTEQGAMSGEGVIVKPAQGKLELMGSIRP